MRTDRRPHLHQSPRVSRLRSAQAAERARAMVSMAMKVGAWSATPSFVARGRKRLTLACFFNTLSSWPSSMMIGMSRRPASAMAVLASRWTGRPSVGTALRHRWR